MAYIEPQIYIKLIINANINYIFFLHLGTSIQQSVIYQTLAIEIGIKADTKKRPGKGRFAYYL